MFILVLPYLNGPEEKEVKGDAESIANLTCDVVGYPIKFEWRDEDNFLGNSHVCCSTLCSSVDPSNTLTTNQCTTEQVLSREKHFASYKYLKLDRGGELEHRRTGLEILGGGEGGHEFARLAPKAREPLGAFGGMLPKKILKIESI